MITKHVLQRTHRIRYGKALATCFTLDIDSKQYIITAKHVVQDIKDGDAVDFFRGEEWHSIPVELVGHAKDNIDISVLSPAVGISPRHKLRTGFPLALGMDAYFLGFPFGMYSTMKKDNFDFPLPLVRKASIAGFGDAHMSHEIYLDGFNNPGFSGGPVVVGIPVELRILDPGKYKGQYPYHVVGVISGYRIDYTSIADPTGKDTGLMARGNSGLVVAHSIEEALKLIRANPIGYPLKDQNKVKDDTAEKLARSS